MKYDNDIELTPEEEKAIRMLKKLEKQWPKSLWLFSASGSLNVMRCDENGEQVMQPNADGGGVDQNYVITTIDIPNDGGDW